MDWWIEFLQGLTNSGKCVILKVIMSDFPTKPKQLSLGLSDDNGSTKVVYNGVPARKATFKAGMETSVHRWFRLTPSFGPDLVQVMLAEMGFIEGEVVFDPFAGAATTLIECQLHGIESYGYEINPFLYFVGKTCLNWEIDPKHLEQAFRDVDQKFHELRELHSEADLDTGVLNVPKIHNPFRWWRRDVLTDALVLKLAIKTAGFPSPIEDFFVLGLAAVLVPDLTNITLGRLQLHFVDRDNDTIDVWETFSQHMRIAIDDLVGVYESGAGNTSSIYYADATSVESPVPPKPVNLVITSPPYPNRYSYVWNTRPHLFFFDMFDKPRQSAELDKETIGGTWGSATSILAKGTIEPQYPILQEVVGPVVEEIRQQDNLMANYLMKYFNMLTTQIVVMDRMLTKRARLAYVVGCSRLKGVFVETDVLLAKVLEGLGLDYDPVSVERIRRRNSGKNLYESIVYARKTV